MSTSIIAFLLLSKFRTVSVVNRVLHLIVGLLQGVTFSQLAVEYKWMVREAGSRGRWALILILLTLAILATFYTMQKGDANIVGHQSQ